VKTSAATGGGSRRRHEQQSVWCHAGGWYVPSSPCAHLALKPAAIWLALCTLGQLPLWFCVLAAVGGWTAGRQNTAAVFAIEARDASGAAAAAAGGG
jgi:hypothetical protein